MSAEFSKGLCYEIWYSNIGCFEIFRQIILFNIENKNLMKREIFLYLVLRGTKGNGYKSLLKPNISASERTVH